MDKKIQFQDEYIKFLFDGLNDSEENLYQQGVENEDVDTEESEVIEEREYDLETDQSISDRPIRKQIMNEIKLKKTALNNLVTIRLPVVKGKAKGITGIFDTWSCLLDEIMIDTIVKYTNQYIDSIKSNFARSRDAIKTDSTEILAVFGILYLAGVNKLGRHTIEDLWDKNGLGIEIFRLTMSIKRFQFLYRSLRFDDRDTRSERQKIDRLAPIRELFEKFGTNCQACYTVSENVTVHEILAPFKGKCQFLQYMAHKRVQYGIKIFALTDAKMFYTCNLEIYAGKQPEGPYSINNLRKDVFERMIKPLQETEETSFYNNTELDIDMLDKMCMAYNLARITCRWPMVILFSMLNIAGINSQIIYCSNGNENMPRRKFLKALGMELIKPQLFRRMDVPNLPITLTHRIAEILQVAMFSQYINPADENTRKRCRPCKNEKKNRKTKYSCRQCGQYLCLQHCQFICLECCQVNENIVE